jgi:hypothetical protein
MIVCCFVGKHERRAMDPLIGMVDKLYPASHLHDQLWRHVTWGNVRALYLFTKKPDASGACNRSHVAYQRNEAVTIRFGQNDRRSLQRLHFIGVS